MDKVPYELPEGWRWVRLGEVIKLKNGKFIRKSELNTSGPVRVYGSNGVIGYTSREKVLVDRETLAIGRVGASGVVNWVIPPAWISDNALYLVKLAPDCDLKYLFHVLQQSGLASLAKQGAQPSISQEQVYQVSIPLPPLSEQRRIVARIEELMGRIREARRLREEACQDTERLWQSVLAEIFPRPGDKLPEGWRWVRLGEVCKVFAGSPAPQGEQYFRDGHFLFVRVQDLGRHGITTNLVETADLVNEKAAKGLRLKKAKAGTILFPKSGAAILTNSRAILGKDAYIVSHLAAVEPNTSFVHNLWVFYWLCTVDMSQFIDNPAYPSLRLSKIKELYLPLPPLSEQRRIVAHLEAVQERIKAIKEGQAQMEAELKRLEQAILDRAFRGEL